MPHATLDPFESIPLPNAHTAYNFLSTGRRGPLYSHTRLRSRDHHTSNTLVGGKGGAGPSSIYIMLEGPTEYVNARWM
jgi:hypothetical protein